jgi:hypothetical protein
MRRPQPPKGSQKWVAALKAGGWRPCPCTHHVPMAGVGGCVAPGGSSRRWWLGEFQGESKWSGDWRGPACTHDPHIAREARAWPDLCFEQCAQMHWVSVLELMPRSRVRRESALTTWVGRGGIWIWELNGGLRALPGSGSPSAGVLSAVVSSEIDPYSAVEHAWLAPA